MFSILKWTIIGLVGCFAVLVLYFIFFPGAGEEQDTPDDKAVNAEQTEHRKADSKQLPAYLDLPKGSILFETTNNESGKITVVEVVEEQYEPGVLVIPLLPIPIGKKHNVTVHHFFYTQKDGRSRRIPNLVKNLALKSLIDAIYFKEDPFTSSEDIRYFQLDSTFTDQLATLADCIFKNKKDLNSFLGNEISAVAIVRSTEHSYENIFYAVDQNVENEQSVGFEYSGGQVAELRIVYRLKEGNLFYDRDITFGEIFLDPKLDLLNEIQKVSPSDFRELSPKGQKHAAGLQYRLFNYRTPKPPTIEQVFHALKSLPNMVSKAQKTFSQYYLDRQDLRKNRKRYLL